MIVSAGSSSSADPEAVADGDVIDAERVRSWVETTLCFSTRSTMSSACSMPARASRSWVPPATSGNARATPFT